jgi:hypothetical protein
MAKESWKATETDIDVALTGCKMQAESHGLDLDDPKVMAFLEHQAKVMGTASAESRWLRGIINEQLEYRL